MNDEEGAPMSDHPDAVESAAEGVPHRAVAERPTDCAILAFRSPRSAERFCREAGWDYQGPRVLYPVDQSDLVNLGLDHWCIVTDGDTKYRRFNSFPEQVAVRLEELADHLGVQVIHKDEILDEGES